MLDLLIKSGLVMDGTGNQGYPAAVGVEGETVRILRRDVSSVQAAKTIDATGMVVCPGFIDMHAHSGLMALHQPRHEPKVRQGVTTELIGVDGISYAPLPTPEDFDSLLLLNAGLDGSPPLPRRWSTVAEYLSLFDDRVACNFAYLIGNSALRISTMGWDDRRPTGEELETMRSLVRQGMEEGAFGISTGLTYPPGGYADTSELVELSREVARLGGIYVTHVRYTLGDQFLDPYREAIEIGRQSGVAVHISHLHNPRPGGARRLLALVDDALLEGLDVTYDSYSYPYSSSRMEAVLPDWAHDGGPDRLLELMRSPEGRRRMAESLTVRAPSWDAVLVTNFSRPHNQRWDGKSLAAIAEGLGKSIIDTLCDLLLEEEMRLSYVILGGNPLNIREFFRHPAHMVGSDALLFGDHVNPRSYGCFPLVLGDFVREEQVLELAQAIRKMTSFPAQRLGLHDRGILRDGMKADIVVFDPRTVRANATLAEPCRYPDGIEYVVVNGKTVVEKGQHTGRLPGRALRYSAGGR
ncbi:MAG: D-aminoacylase [Chloroflexi bacterium]|nr:D-aminoacylase [Chloroflexota bacterium]